MYGPFYRVLVRVIDPTEGVNMNSTEWWSISATQGFLFHPSNDRAAAIAVSCTGAWCEAPSA